LMVCPRCHEEKGTLAAIGALALLTMIHKDVGDVLNEAVLRLHVDPDNWYVHTLITRLSGTTPRQLEAVSAESLLYASLRYVEGLGLLWRQRWAAYVTVIEQRPSFPLTCSSSHGGCCRRSSSSLR
jgi:uncharacterized membrane protein (DUF2068 family)